jgi:hypothetical protein
MPVAPRPADEPQQEYVGNAPTDVEVEDADEGITRDPWDPDLIRIHTRSYSLRQLVDMIDDGDVDLAPDFQREYVWKAPQRWGLIESLLLGIPLPSFYFNEDRDGRLQVVDGVQRLTTIHRFYKDQIPLGPLTYLQLEGRTFSRLDAPLRRRLQSRQLVAHVIDPQTPYRVKFDVFKRINTGGTPLSAQEIRHCMSLDRSRAFLRRLVSLPQFHTVMGPTVLHHPRMAAQELALRLIAFHVLPVERYRAFSSLDTFLGEVTDQLDRAIPDADLDKLAALAATGLQNAHAVFGAHAFRKWPEGSTRLNPINRTLVETWGHALSLREPAAVSARAAALQARARAMMTTSPAFIASISGGTGDAQKLEARMALVAQAVDEVLG